MARTPKPATVRTPVAEREAIQRSIAWAAIAKVAAAEGCRDHLNPGTHEVAGVFAGEVDGDPIQLDLAGQLQIGVDATAASSKGEPPAHVLALCLSHVPKTRRSAILDDLPEHYSRDGVLPAADPQLLVASEKLLESLRSRSTVSRKGTVHFSRAA